MKNIHLLVIDPQNDFCDKSGALYVENADKDMNRLSDFIFKYSRKLSGITITFDLHKIFHIANPIFWVDSLGAHPAPFTIINLEDIKSGKYVTSNKQYEEYGRFYVEKLESNGRYELTIWPPHCIIGTSGSNIYKDLLVALDKFEAENSNKINYVFKSINSFTEQYSILYSDVNSSEFKDNSNLNIISHDNFSGKEIMKVVNNNDIILVAGEALSHCVANSILDIGKERNNDLSNFILLRDTTSNVKGFEKLGDNFIDIAKSYGMKVEHTNNLEHIFNE